MSEREDYFVDFIDLHVHTTASDGALSLCEVIEAGRNVELNYIALTDHDNAVYSPENIRKCNEQDPEFLVEEERAILRSGSLGVIQGIELTTRHGVCNDNPFGYSMHMVGLFTNYPPEDLEARFNRIRNLRLERLLDMAKKINIREITNPEGDIVRITPEEVKELVGGGVASRLHLGYLLHEKGIGNSPMHARDLFIGEDSVRYVPFSDEIMSTEEGIYIIHNKLEGLCFVAHPGALNRALNPKETVKTLKHMGVDGLEYSSHPEYNEIGKREGMLFSFGNDFHGKKYKPDVRLGKIVSQRKFKLLMEERNKYSQAKH
jgi:hypothetical protein